MEYLDFDRGVDMKKEEIRLMRWRQIVRFQRKPNAIQAKILLEDLITNIGFIALVAALWFWFKVA